MSTNPYTTQAASGYDSSPPADDGSAVAANQVKWSTIKSKITDPIKTLADNINSAVLSAFGSVVTTTNDDSNQMGGSLAFATSTLTIASGVVTATRSHHAVDTEAAAATDTLDKILTASVADGCLLNLYLANAGHVVTVTHEFGVAGQIHLLSGSAFTFVGAKDTLTLQRRGNDWYQVAVNKKGTIVQVVNTQTGAMISGATATPLDDTIPQITEGYQFMTLAITPTVSTNKLMIDVVFTGQASAAADGIFALFQDSTANAVAAVLDAVDIVSNGTSCTHFRHYMTAGTTSSTTFQLRVGTAAGGTITMNGFTAARKLGGVCASSITITEISV